MTQLHVDQGLASIVVSGFLENCHGKWHADLLFGQGQRRAENVLVLGVDDQLDVFGAIKRKDGDVAAGYVLNPVATIDLVAFLSNIGYETSPPQHLRFTDRNVHFAVAAAADESRNVPRAILDVIADLVRTAQGMVRLSRSPPSPYRRCPSWLALLIYRQRSVLRLARA